MELERVRRSRHPLGINFADIVLKRRFPRQPEVLEYLNYVADKYVL